MSRRENERCFAEFVAGAERSLGHAAYLLTRDRHHAEDLVQTALTKTWGAWSKANRDPYAYTRRCMLNAYLDQRKRDRKVAMHSSDTIETDADLAPGGEVASGESAVDDRDELLALLGRLSPRERSVVVLRYYLDLAEQDVAADLGVSVGTVKSTASRALARLRVDTTGSAVAVEGRNQA